MEMHLGHCRFIIFFEWIWFFTITSTLGGTKAEVMCIPVCQLPLIAVIPREPPALDLTNYGEAPAEEFVGFIEGSPSAKRTVGRDEERNVVKVTVSEGSSSKVQPGFGGNTTSFNQKDALNGQQKLSHPKLLPQSVLRATTLSLHDADINDNSTGDGKNNSLDVENLANVNVAMKEDTDAVGWRRTRSTRSAETWSGFRPEVEEDVSFSDQEEFQLTSSTFALTGDTAHNQAMVHWSGQNSSVSRSCVPILRTACLTQYGQCSFTHLGISALYFYLWLEKAHEVDSMCDCCVVAEFE